MENPVIDHLIGAKNRAVQEIKRDKESADALITEAAIYRTSQKRNEAFIAQCDAAIATLSGAEEATAPEAKGSEGPAFADVQHVDNPEVDLDAPLEYVWRDARNTTELQKQFAYSKEGGPGSERYAVRTCDMEADDIGMFRALGLVKSL